jgi:hypothetical protein
VGLFMGGKQVDFALKNVMFIGSFDGSDILIFAVFCY